MVEARSTLELSERIRGLELRAEGTRGYLRSLEKTNFRLETVGVRDTVRELSRLANTEGRSILEDTL